MTIGTLGEASLAAITPRGWLRRWLELQKEGLTGHLEVAGYPFDSGLWACAQIPWPRGRGAPWWPYEQTAYWVDGLTRCAILLDDPHLLQRARRQMTYVLDHADADGYLGPRSCKKPMPAGRWSHMIFFRALLAWYHHQPDPRIPRALIRHYLGAPTDHSGHRDVCNIEILCWLYRHSGDRRLLDMARATWDTYQQTGEDDDRELTRRALRNGKPVNSHGVTFLETVKQPALLAALTGERALLQDTRNGFDKLERFHLLASGAPSSTEHLHTTTALDAAEMCDIADFTWSGGHLLLATGDARWGDAVERNVLNAFPGGVTKDFRALQYFSSVNQVILTRHSNHTLAATGGAWMCYRPKPGTECCTGQVNRVMPAYVSRMWMLQGDDPVAALYGPGSFCFTKNGHTVTLHQETTYPFGEEISFGLQTRSPVEFTLWLRLPHWCDTPRLVVNNRPFGKNLRPGRFVPIRRTFEHNDRVVLTLPMHPRFRRWADGGVTIERGPLLFALPVQEQRSVDRSDPHQSPAFPSWEMVPVSPWNYAICIDPDGGGDQVEVRFAPPTTDPWSNPPVRIAVPARRVKGWKVRIARALPSIGGTLIDPARNKWEMHQTIARGRFPVTPPLPDPATLAARLGSRRETIELVPFGCTTLRIAQFPCAHRAT